MSIAITAQCTGQNQLFAAPFTRIITIIAAVIIADSEKPFDADSILISN